jgi:hypothetical protein
MTENLVEMDFLRRIARRFAHGVAWRLEAGTPWIGKMLSPVAAERCIFYDKLGYIPHLRHPRTFNEKICHRKLFNPVPRAAMLADKFAVRKFVADRGCPEILNEVLLVTKHPEEIDFAKLPQRFVIKATHGSGWNIIVKNKEEIVSEEIVGQCKIWMNSVYGEWARERHYRDIPPAIMIEKFLFDAKYEVPPDYKFLVFHGKCHFIQVDYGRFTEHTQTIYNTGWEAQDFTCQQPRGIVDPEKPATLKRMLEIAEVLARDIDFCRVDLYSINDRDVYFGEMTLTPWAGFTRFRPTTEGDLLMGALW